MTPESKKKIARHLAKNHLAYSMALVLAAFSGLVYADHDIPDFEKSRSKLQGNLLEIASLPIKEARVTSPAEGQTYHAGQTMTIEWEGEAHSSRLYLLPQSEKRKGKLIKRGVQGHSINWRIPETIEAGFYAIGLKNGKYTEKSEGFFRIEGLPEATEKPKKKQGQGAALPQRHEAPPNESAEAEPKAKMAKKNAIKGR